MCRFGLMGAMFGACLAIGACGSDKDDDDNGGGNDNPGGGSHPGVSPDGSDSLPGGASMDTVPGYTTI